MLKNGIFASPQYWENEIIEIEIKRQDIKKNISIRKVDSIKFPTSTGFFSNQLFFTKYRFYQRRFYINNAS